MTVDELIEKINTDPESINLVIQGKVYLILIHNRAQVVNILSLNCPVNRPPDSF